MLKQEFINAKYAYRVRITDMHDFLKECTEQALYWSHGCIAEAFDPFKFYEGEKIDYLKPLMKINDRNYIYIKCFDGYLSFSFERDWFFNPYFDYVPSAMKM